MCDVTYVHSSVVLVVSLSVKYVTYIFQPNDVSSVTFHNWPGMTLPSRYGLHYRERGEGEGEGEGKRGEERERGRRREGERERVRESDSVG